ncbi:MULTISPECIES: class I SAM-dependent methyltransferase [Thermomonosporaceae]|uniref:class I SAM-dependent methyltransferase n=1 Tax=Thermomonosporaceae TaxID=2012 RepID=UPI00255B1B40|nr:MULTISPECIES: methyltransferase domain-containing protein [Thermomonosporaceae]MDL4776914.1 methyltransferase domain-containing protein [Actinomadura xylanilytica]
MIGQLYEEALRGRPAVEIEDADGRRRPLPVGDWLALRPGDTGLLDRCAGATLDVGSGPGRLTVALAGRGLPVLGIDIAPSAVALAQAAGGPALCRDVFGRVPGAGRWRTVLLADGNIGIGGDPVVLVRRVAGLLAPGGRILVEVEPPGSGSRTEPLRLRAPGSVGEWFAWARVSADAIRGVAADSAVAVTEAWEEAGRWFVALSS